MRKFVFAVLAAWCCCGVSAQNTSVKSLGDSKFEMAMGKLTMVVDAGGGGKILSFRHGEQEVISQLTMREAFGSTFWTSPQKEWNWPPVQEYDKMAYAVEEREDVLVMTSKVSERLGFQIRKEFSMDEGSGAFVVAYSIVNRGDVSRKVAPWEITRVLNEGGLIFFDAPVEGISPAGLMDFSSEHGAAWYLADEAAENRKINADGRGWLAYKNERLLLIKVFEDLEVGQPAPDEAEIQVYVNRGRSYIELESQGAYTELAPGEELNWTVRWYLLPDSSPVKPSKGLVRKVEKLI